jgi:hypothetical protein
MLKKVSRFFPWKNEEAPYSKLSDADKASINRFGSN